jgi:CDGSH-type Zn-finger protein
MPNVLEPQVDGPMKVEGEVEILAADGSLVRKTSQAWLCRCGKSASKPFCDGSHKKIGFRDGAQVSSSYQPKAIDPGTPGPILRLTLKPNGPIRCFGEVEIHNRSGQRAWVGIQASICRCGQSRNKPFCDGSHRDSGFEAG